MTIELKGEAPDVHLHAGGQGFWIARMIRSLEMPVTLCGSFGPEVGEVVIGLIEREGVAVRAVASAADNPAYVHDRREGGRTSIVETPWPVPSRHEVDELYSLTVVEAMEADACVLGGTPGPHVVPDDVYRRLAVDLRSAGKLVVADLTGTQLTAALEGGVSVLKVSHESLIEEGRAARDDVEELVAAMRRLQEAGAERVVVSRSDRPALALAGTLLEVTPPRFEPVDARGAGDSMTAAITTALVRGGDWESALRIAVAAGALNTTRRGLATGTREEIEQLAGHVAVRPLDVRVEAKEQHAEETPDELAARARPA